MTQLPKKVHDLKIESEYYVKILVGDKTFEIRKNDRDFQKDEFLILREIDENGQYTGRALLRKITYITDYEQKKGFVVMAIKECEQ